MKLRVPAFYRDFACIAGACPDSCCQGWEVDADPASMAYYHTLRRVKYAGVSFLFWIKMSTAILFFACQIKSAVPF